MKRRQLIVLVSLFLLTILCSFGLGKDFLLLPSSAQSNNLTISAAISLKEALEEVKTLYQQAEPEVKITYNFGSSGSLQQQIERGAPVDIFISAASKQMDALQTKNFLLSGSRRNLLTNQLVLITPKAESIINKFEDLTNPKVTKIALGEPKSVPAGQYGEEVLKYYQILEQIKDKLIYGKDVRQVLTYVETGNVSAGLVYITDAKKSKVVRIAATAPRQSHQPIVYPMAIIKDSKNLNAAQDFVKFLTSAASKDVFKKYGFGT